MLGDGQRSPCQASSPGSHVACSWHLRNTSFHLHRIFWYLNSFYRRLWRIEDNQHKLRLESRVQCIFQVRSSWGPCSGVGCLGTFFRRRNSQQGMGSSVSKLEIYKLRHKSPETIRFVLFLYLKNAFSPFWQPKHGLQTAPASDSSHSVKQSSLSQCVLVSMHI